METEKKKQHEALNIFLTKVFNDRMKRDDFDTVMNDEEKEFYYKVWLNGVQAGMDLNDAIVSVKAGDI